MKRMTTEEFIAKAKKVHGDKYDYSKVEYVNNSTKICIICPKHGEFLQKPINHLHGQGCAKCSGNVKLTTEDFITEARKIHGNRYDYSKVEYVNSATKVRIICPEHGEFWQTPNSHLTGRGCLKCSIIHVHNKQKSTTEEFIVKAKEIHGNRYDYSKVEYINGKINVCIICPEHGEFWQKPNSHLNGTGCPKCYGSTKKSTEEFIRQAQEIHGNKYDYSKVNYVNSGTKVCIICPEHGEFWQIPSSHLRGYGCPKCSGKAKKTTKDFIIEARKIHGDKYDYSKVEYINALKKVCIICPEHGEFWQTPSAHLYGHGCLKCSIINVHNKQKSTTEDFITEARKIHGNKYDYSKVDYVNSGTKVCIICSEHGEFWQIPSSHLTGHGCPYCSLNTNFLKGDKLRLIEEIDLLSMSSFALMALIGINKLPEEFKSIARFARNSQDRQNAINKLKELYGSDSDDIQDIQNIDINNTEIQSEEYSCDTFDNTDDFNQDDNSLNVFNEIESVDKVLAKDSVDDIVNFGDNEEFILRTEVNGLLNSLLKDMEKARLNKSTNLPTIIRIKAEFSTATPWKKYVYTEFLRIYDNVKNMKAS